MGLTNWRISYRLLAMAIQIEHFRDWLASANQVCVFTGAGLSVASGIPDFRSKGGLWEQFDPSVVASFSVFKRDPMPFWEMAQACDQLISAARPNPAHAAIAAMESLGKEVTVITQNIDALHQQAGSTTVLELHGSSDGATCIDCGHQASMEEIRVQITAAGIPPKCSSCGGFKVKTNVILFGEELPSEVFESAEAATRKCDLFIVVGSSLEVSPANELPRLAKRGGAKVVFVNKDASEMDSIADMTFVGALCEELLPLVVDALKGLTTKALQ